MTLSIGSTAPDFTAETTQGTITFHDWMGDVVLPSKGLHPGLRN